MFASATPSVGTFIRCIQNGQVAQLVEQRTENPRVGGSTPSLATIKTDKTKDLKEAPNR